MRTTFLPTLLAIAGLLLSPEGADIAFNARAGNPGTALRAQEPGSASGPRRAAPDSLVEHFRTLQHADSLYAAGRYAEAGPLYRMVAEVDPENGVARFRWARGLFAEGEVGPALEILEELISGGWVNESRVAAEVSRAFAGAGEAELALRWARRAVDAGYENRPAFKGEAFAPLHDDPRFREVAGLPPGDDVDREGRWHHDLDFLLEEARRLHAAPVRIARSEAWSGRIEALKADVGTLSDAEIVVRIQRILAALGDGHTVLYPPSAREMGLGVLPLRFYFFSDGLFVIDADEVHRELVGRRVVEIGRRSVDGLLDDLDPLVSRDNRHGLEWIGPLYLRVPAFLRDMGYGNRIDGATLTLEAADGRRSTVTVEVGSGPEGSQLVPPPAAGREGAGQEAGRGQPPHWLHRVDEAFWHEPLEDRSAVYAQLNQVRDAGDWTLDDFMGAVQVALVEGDRRHLILDLRHNSGGNNFLIWPVVRTVMHHEARDPRNRTWVLVGRNTFSAAQNLVNFLERETEAVLVGEPTSSKPNFVGETSDVELPYSGLRMSISSRYWQDSFPGDDRPWIPVKIPVELSSADWLAGRDPVLEAVFAVLDG